MEPTTHSSGKYKVTISEDGAIAVKKGDWVSKYSAALHRGDTSRVNEYGRLRAGHMDPLADVNKIIAGETLYHVPSYRSWLNAHGKETLIEKEGDVTAGALDVNDAYDLALLRQPDGDYNLRLFMKVQFFFENHGHGEWTLADKRDYVRKWKRSVRRAWDRRLLRTLKGGQRVRLSLAFKTQIEGWMFDHWEITVHKVGATGGFRSYVQTGLGNVHITELDAQEQTRCTATACFKQVTNAHEFAHMLGLGDEYGPDVGGKPGPHAGDRDSLLNIGSRIRPRHRSDLRHWVDRALAKHSIE